MNARRHNFKKITAIENVITENVHQQLCTICRLASTSLLRHIIVRSQEHYIGPPHELDVKSKESTAPVVNTTFHCTLLVLL